MIILSPPSTPSRRPEGRLRGSLWRWALALVITLGGSAEAGEAQMLQEPLVPAGRARLDFSPSFSAWDTRYGIDADGNAVEEALGDDLTDPLGTRLFPGIATLEEQLRAMAGSLSFSPALGNTQGMVKKDVARINLTLELGIFDWLTIGGTVPWVRNRTTVDLAFTAHPDPQLGLNPRLTSGSDVTATLETLAGAASAARARAQGLCDAGAGGCSSAQDLANRMTAFASAAQAAYDASPFFPLSSSAAAGDLRRALSDLDSELSAAGLGGTGTVLPFATEQLDDEAFADLPTDPVLGFQGTALENVEGLWELGDVEVHATVRLLEGEVRDSGAAHPRLSWSLAGGGLVRLGTGLVDDPDVFLDMGTGDGQMDFEGRLFGALRVGQRLGFRAEGLYGIQQGYDLLRRVVPHEVILAPFNTTRAVRWEPGAYMAFAVSPRFHLTDELSLGADYRYFWKGDDSYEIIGDATAGGVTVDAADLEHESGVTLQEAALALRYSTMNAWRAGETGPVELNLRYVRSVAGAGGRTPKATRIELGFRLFRRIWGAP